MTAFTIHYMKPEFFRDGCMGYDWLAKHGPMPSLDKLADTHVELSTMEYQFVEGELKSVLERVWIDMQAENWSPNGEARPLIQSKGLGHTSMTVGDIIVVDGKLFIADRFGFKEIEEQPAQGKSNWSRANTPAATTTRPTNGLAKASNAASASSWSMASAGAAPASRVTAAVAPPPRSNRMAARR